MYMCVFYMYILCRYILWTLSIHFMDFVSFINNYIPYFIVVCIDIFVSGAGAHIFLYFSGGYW